MIKVKIPTLKVNVSGFIQRSGGATSEYNVRNSDSTYSQNITGNIVLPDITFTDYDGTTSQVPSVQNVSATQLSAGYVYPDNGEIYSFRTGDSGWQNANWWKPLINNAGDKLTQRLNPDDPYSLVYNNSFGNKIRFTFSDGTAAPSYQSYNGEVIYDNYQGIQIFPLGWDGNILSTRTWDQSIDEAYNYNSEGWALCDSLTFLKIWNRSFDNAPSIVGDFLNQYVIRPSFRSWLSTSSRSQNEALLYQSLQPLRRINKTTSFTDTGLILIKPIENV